MEYIAGNENIFIVGILIGFCVPRFFRVIVDLIIDTLAVSKGCKLEDIENWQKEREYWRTPGATGRK